LTKLGVTKLDFLVAGRLDQITGGYLFDRRIVEGLRESGRMVVVHELAGSHPAADGAARDAVATALAALPDGSGAVLDGMVLPAAAECLPREAGRLRLVAFVHHPLALETGISAAESAHLAALERRLLPLLRGAICPSPATEAALLAYGVEPRRVAVVPPGTGHEIAPGNREVSGGPVRLLTVAMLTPRKGHLILAAALARLAALDWRWTCIGSRDRDPATTAALQAFIAGHDLGDRVVLAGEFLPEDLAAAYRAADCFVLPSFHEGYGMAFAEALAHGLPIVACRAGAVPDLVPDSAGILVPPGDEAALAIALRQVIADPALRRRLAGGAAKAGAALPDWPESVERWAAAFDRLVA
jgi:glycosyltransferase involved in cell wall biosynthesis